MVMEKAKTIGEMLKMLLRKGKYVLLALFLILLVFALLILFGQATGLGPLFYPFI